MTVRNLEHLFNPGSVALIGASAEPRSVGATITKNLLGGGLSGPIRLVNPRHRQIGEQPCYGSIADLPEAPDLAVIATPPGTIPRIIDELGRKGAKAAVAITAGLDPTLRTAMLEASRPYCLRIVGPNCLGIWVPRLSLNASFGHIAPAAGRLAFLSQSGALAGAVLDWAASRQIGFSAVVSMGDMADVDVGDLLDFFATDVSTRAILLYLETIPAARKFMSAARSAARAKPVVVMKAGRTQAAAQVAATHTGALAGADEVADAAFHRAGLLRVAELEELFTAAETLTRARPIAHDKLTILTNGGGAGVLAVDQLGVSGGQLAPLSETAVQRLDRVLPANWSKANPIDIIGDATPERYRAALEILLDENADSAILVMNCPTAIASSSGAADAVVDLLEERRRSGPAPTVLCNWLGAEAAVEARRRFAVAGLPSYESPADAVRGFKHLWGYTKVQEALARTPPRNPQTPGIDQQAARQVLREAAADGHTLLNEVQAKALLAAYGIATVPTRIAADPAGVEQAAEHFLGQSGAVVVKILSQDISHKSDVGGVQLRLSSAQEAREAAAAMLERIARLAPAARIRGFTVQPMIVQPRAHELLLGVADDPLFGPVILFGAGGTAAEILKDKAVALPPLDAKLARSLVEETRIFRLLRGYRDRPPANLESIVETLVRLSQLVIDCAAVRELDINPLLVDEGGTVALDARVRIAPEDVGLAGLNPRLAIRPYPSQWETTEHTRSGAPVSIRPIRPADEHLYGAFVARLSPEDIRFRFLAPTRQFSHEMVARFTQIDYARAMAFIAVNPDETELLGVARLSADPDYTCAEYAIIVRSDLKGQGVGWALMQHLIRYARSEGLRELYGEVLRANTSMVQMCRELGFHVGQSPDDPALCRVSFRLQPESGASF